MPILLNSIVFWKKLVYRKLSPRYRILNYKTFALGTYTYVLREISTDEPFIDIRTAFHEFFIKSCLMFDQVGFYKRYCNHQIIKVTKQDKIIFTLSLKTPWWRTKGGAGVWNSPPRFRASNFITKRPNWKNFPCEFFNEISVFWWWKTCR